MMTAPMNGERRDSKPRPKSNPDARCLALAESRLLSDCSLELASARDEREALRVAASRMCEVARASRCDIYVREGDWLVGKLSVDDDALDETFPDRVHQFAPRALFRLAMDGGDIVFVTDVGRDQRATTADVAEWRRRGLQSGVLVPLDAGDGVMGLVAVFDGARRDTGCGPILGALSRVVARALVTAHLHERSEAQKRQLRALVTATRSISSDVLLDDVLEHVLIEVGMALDVSSCELHRYEPQRDRLVLQVRFEAVPRDGRDPIGTTYPLTDRPGLRTVLESGRPLQNVAADPDLDAPTRRSMLAKGERTVLALVVRPGNAPPSLLLLAEHRRDRRFDSDEIDVAQALAGQTALAVRNATQYEEQRRQNVQLTSLLESSRAAASSLNVDEILARVARSAAAALDSPCCLIWDYDSVLDASTLRGYWERVPSGYSGLGETTKMSDYPAALAILSGRRPVVESLSDAHLDPVTRESMEKFGEKTCLSVPLRYGDEALGMLMLDETEAERAFMEDELELAAGIAEQAAIALHHAALFVGKEREAERLASLLGVSRAVNSTLVFDEVLDMTVREAAAAMRSQECMVYEWDRECDAIVARGYYGPDADGWPGRGLSHSLDEYPDDRRILENGLTLEEYISDSALDPVTRSSMDEHGELSTLTLALMVGGQAIGQIIFIETSYERRWTAQDVELAHLLADLAAAALHNAQLFEQVRRQNEQLEAAARRLALINESSMAVGSSLELSSVLATAATRFCEVLDVTGCDIHRLQGRDELVCIVAVADGRIWDDWAGRRQRLDEAPCDELAISTGSPVTIETISDDRLSAAERALMIEWGEKSALVVPLVARGITIGVVELLESRRERVFTPEEIATAEALCRPAALAIDNAELHERQELDRRELAALLESRSQRATEHELLIEAARRMSASLDAQQVVQEGLAVLRSAVTFERGAVALIDHDGAVHRLLTESGQPIEQAEPEVLPAHLLSAFTGEQVIVPGSALPFWPTYPESRAGSEVLLVGLSGAHGRSGLLCLSGYRSTMSADVASDLLSGFAAHLSLSLVNAGLYENVREMHLANLRALASTLLAKDTYTVGHAHRVAVYTALLARRLGWTPDLIDGLEEAAFLHDVGKVAISDRILLKPGPLNAEEWQMIRQHPQLGADILASVLEGDLVAAVRHHHERWDGMGYPAGLAGEHIPPAARAMAIADAYDAMSSLQAHSPSCSYGECRRELVACSGTQFDPVMVAAFLEVLGDLEERKATVTAVAAEAADQIDAEQHERVWAEQDPRSGDYREIAAILARAAKADPSVESIMTEIPKSQDATVAVVNHEDKGSPWLPPGTVMPADEEEHAQLSGRPYSSLGLYVDQWGTWICGFAPVRDAAGRVAALVCASAPALIDAGQGRAVGEAARTLTSLLSMSADRAARAEVEAITDPLTGLYNHRHFHERLRQLTAAAQERSAPVSLLFCDLDEFKAVNDAHGHRSGDQALRRVAEVLLRTIRGSDLAARYGGDEFALLFADTDREAALAVAERIRADLTAELGGSQFTGLSVSIGVAELPRDAETAEALIERADQAMYLAKAGGRNRVCAPPEDRKGA